MAHKVHVTKTGRTVWVRAQRLDTGTYLLDGEAVKRSALPAAIANLLDADASVTVGSAATPRKRATTKRTK